MISHWAARSRARSVSTNRWPTMPLPTTTSLLISDLLIGAQPTDDALDGITAAAASGAGPSPGDNLGRRARPAPPTAHEGALADRVALADHGRVRHQCRRGLG